MALLTVSGITKSFSGTPVLQDVSFRVDEGDILCLLGPSGCGKTTLLRIVAGLETADAGQVALEGRPLGEIPVHSFPTRICLPTWLLVCGCKRCPANRSRPVSPRC
jgi:ABC-type Fe3+/spermidine/putrescine transport system ATPase subunit